jgi:membrane protein
MAPKAHRRTFDRPTALALVVMALVAVDAFERTLFRPRDRRSGAFGEGRASDEPIAMQHLRAQEKGRGRDARHPGHIPWRGWIDIALRAGSGVSKHRLMAVAAGAAFYQLLALFPGISVVVSVYGLIASSRQIRDHLSTLADLVPKDVLDIIGSQIDRITAAGTGSLSLTVGFSLALSLWSANAGMKALFDALNVIYDEDEKRGIIALNLVSLAFTIAVVGFLIVSLAAMVAVPLILARLPIAGSSEWILAALRWPLLALVVALGLSALYRFGPSRRKAKWRWVSVGSVVGAVTWLAASAAFSWYLVRFADYNATYGSLGAAIGLLTWLWISAIVILLGAQLNAEIEHQTARDSTTGEHERPLGERQAVMADTVGEAQD